MGEIIKFKIETIEESFIKSLTEEQNEIFYEIIARVQADYENLEAKYIEKIAECEMLRLENQSLKEQ